MVVMVALYDDTPIENERYDTDEPPCVVWDWLNHEKEKLSDPERYSRHGSDFHLSLNTKIWYRVKGLLRRLALAGWVDRATFEKTPVLSLVHWLREQNGGFERLAENTRWDEAEELLKAKVAEIESKTDRSAAAEQKPTAEDSLPSSTRSPGVDQAEGKIRSSPTELTDREIQAIQPAGPSSTSPTTAVEPPNETVAADSGRATATAQEVEKSPANEIEPPYLGLSGINLDGEVRRKGYEKPADLSGKKVLRKLYEELLKVRDNPILHKTLARRLNMDERALSSNIGRLKDELLVIDIAVSPGRNHMLIDCRDA